MKWEKLAQSPLEILEKNNAQTPKFIWLEELAVGVCQACRSTARSTGQRSYFRPLCHRSTGRLTEVRYREHCSLSGRPVCRPGPFQRAELSGRSTGSVDRPPARSQACTSVHVGRPPGRPTSELGRPVDRPAEARSEKLRDKNLLIFDSIKSHKITENLQKQF